MTSSTTYARGSGSGDLICATGSSAGSLSGVPYYSSRRVSDGVNGWHTIGHWAFCDGLVSFEILETKHYGEGLFRVLDYPSPFFSKIFQSFLFCLFLFLFFFLI